MDLPFNPNKNKTPYANRHMSIINVYASCNDTLPFAMGLFLFSGCCLSVSTSMMSFRQYILLDIKAKDMAAYIVANNIFQFVMFPLKNRGKKTNRFFSHWCGLINLIYSCSFIESLFEQIYNGLYKETDLAMQYNVLQSGYTDRRYSNNKSGYDKCLFMAAYPLFAFCCQSGYS